MLIRKAKKSVIFLIEPVFARAIYSEQLKNPWIDVPQKSCLHIHFVIALCACTQKARMVSQVMGPQEFFPQISWARSFEEHSNSEINLQNSQDLRLCAEGTRNTDSASFCMWHDHYKEHAKLGLKYGNQHLKKCWNDPSPRMLAWGS